MFTKKKGNFRRATALVTLLTFVLGFAGFPATRAQAAVPAGIDPAVVRAAAVAAGLGALADVEVPEVANLGEFLNADELGVPTEAAKAAAIKLGKALFWDMQVGSDGQACGSCHFSAGADNRVRNQLSPGVKAGDGHFGSDTFPQFRPDYTLKSIDFPFHKLEDPEQNNYLARMVVADTNDVVSSQGVFPAKFDSIILGMPGDLGTPFIDPAFNLLNPNAVSVYDNVRRVEPRNTPTMINAVFNFMNFWDGRAHNQFNGVNPIGPLDAGAKVWVDNAGTLAQQPVAIPNSSLASQAVGPPLSNFEMSFFDRSFPQLGRKLLSLTPLALQVVHPNDSVLGPVSLSPQRGISATYRAMIEAAFQGKYWNGGNVTLPEGTFTQMEANFALFFGLAVQMYETTLVSDQTPFDDFMAGNNDALSQEQLQGLLVFINRGARGNPDPDPLQDRINAAFAAAQTAFGVAIGAGNCRSCHGGPELTDAAVASVEEEPIEIETTALLVNGILQAVPATSFVDNGFANIGVRPTAEDLGRGEGVGQGFPFPLSLVRQALLGLPFAPPLNDECDGDGLPPCPVDNRLSADGGFKIPSLRNVELTGPYFHNGGQATLDQVVEFYDRQGDFGDVNAATLERNMAFVDMHDADEEPLIEFLLSLTDERVRQEMAPFDHPQLFVPNGGSFGHEQPRIVVPAVGADGRPAEGLPPLQAFDAQFVRAKIAVTPRSVHFGDVKEGRDKSRTIIVKSKGETDLAIGQITLASEAGFTIKSDLCSNQTLASPASCTVQVVFKPGTAGAQSATLSIPSNDPDKTVVNVSYSGVGLSDDLPPALSLYPVPGMSKGKSQTISGTVKAGIIPKVSCATATVGPVTVNGTTWSAQISGMKEGANIVTVTATGATGVTTALPATTITVDTIPPALTMDAMASRSKGTTKTISGTVEAGVTPVVTAGSGANVGPITVSDGKWSCQISGLKPGANDVTVTATDAAGNPASKSAAMTVLIADGILSGGGAVGIKDALKALRMAVSLVPATDDDMLHGDVAPPDAQDGKIDVADALLILKKIVGLASY